MLPAEAKVQPSELRHRCKDAERHRRTDAQSPQTEAESPSSGEEPISNGTMLKATTNDCGVLLVIVFVLHYGKVSLISKRDFHYTKIFVLLFRLM